MAHPRDALAELFNHTDGQHWTKRENWLSENRLGLWFGVSVNISGHVVSISLNDNRLMGSIDLKGKFIESLHSIESLYLMSNYIHGPIPASIGTLHALRELNLSWNQLSGHLASIHKVKKRCL